MMALRGIVETSRNETVRHCVEVLVHDQLVTAVEYAHLVRGHVA